MTFALRPYQQDLISQARGLMQKGCRSLIITSPTGSGKTVLTAHMLATAASKGLTSWFVVHRKELIDQSVATFRAVGVPHGITAAGYPDGRRHQIQIASVQTLANRMSKLTPPGLIIYDESHHTAAKTWSAIHASFPRAFHVGLTGTPERLDGKGLRPFFSEMIHGPSVRWLIENKFLSPYRLYAPSSADISGVHTRAGDYAKDELATAMGKSSVTGDAIDHYKRLGNGKRALAFLYSIEASQAFVLKAKAAGISAAHVDGETPRWERDLRMKQFRDGSLTLLANVDLFGEGVDVPALEVMIELRPTASLVIWLQHCGRALRMSPGKEHAIILDHAGNSQRHGLPDAIRSWSLDGKAARLKQDGDIPKAKRCPGCYGMIESFHAKCPFCGHEFTGSGGREVEERDGELVEVRQEVDTDKLKARQEQGAARTEAELIALGEARGYKRPRLWARHILMSRRRRVMA